MPARWKLSSLCALLAAMAFVPCAFGSDSWLLRPGLWEMTVTQQLSADRLAWLAAHHIAAPVPKTQQVCIPAGKNDLSKSIFDPANEPGGACSEKILSDNDGGREIEDDCNLPHMLKLPQPPGATKVDFPPIPAQARRHIVTGGDGAGFVDSTETRGGKPDATLVTRMRWLAAECPVGLPP